MDGDDAAATSVLMANREQPKALEGNRQGDDCWGRPGDGLFALRQTTSLNQADAHEAAYLRIELSSAC
jgi:hypothetical protein